MKSILKFKIIIILILAYFSSEIYAQSLNLIPKPQSLMLVNDHLDIKTLKNVSYNSNDKELQNLASLLVKKFNLHDGELVDNNEKSVFLKLDNSISSDEGYELNINSKNIIIKAKTHAGLFYGIQSLLQIYEIDSKDGLLPQLIIKDNPRFGYRGLHLDVSRHFFDVDFIKKYIDLMSLYKLNKFHWHLTDDQGWRIEIKKYPKLTQIGAFRDSTITDELGNSQDKYDKTRYGGFYTQEQIKDIVAYAKERYVEIIPEIEMPGHSSAALASYPEYGCTGFPIGVRAKWGVSEDIYCPTEETFKFLEDILDEVIMLFPSKYIHIGGDEVPKKAWQQSNYCQELIKKLELKDESGLQSYFIQRIEKYLNSKGKSIIGWDEILEGGLAPNATVMSWRGEEGGVAAANQDHNVIMTPYEFYYFNQSQSSNALIETKDNGYASLKKVYNYNPIPNELSEEKSNFVIGAEACAWAEFMNNPKEVEFQVYPRALALAEVMWTYDKKREFPEFVERAIYHFKYLKNKNVNIGPNFIDLGYYTTNTRNISELSVVTNADINSNIYFTLNDSAPDMNSPKYTGKLALTNDMIFRFIAFKDSIQVSPESYLNIKVNKATGKPVQLVNLPDDKYKKGGIRALTNGVTGSSYKYRDREWLGFLNKDFIATIDLGEKTRMSKLKIRFFNFPLDQIYIPSKIEIYVSDDNKNFASVGNLDINGEAKSKIYSTVTAIRSDQEFRYLKVVVKRNSKIDESNPENYNWLFVDELQLF